MSKKSCNQGYILIESVVSLFILGVVVSLMVMQLSFLMKKNQETVETIDLYQFLYEETGRYCRQDFSPGEFVKDKKTFIFSRLEDGSPVAKVIGYGKEIEVQRKS